MTEIRVHAEKNCRKILRPDCDYSPTIQMWYDRIHAYLQLIRMKEGKTKNTANILRFACRQHINEPERLSIEELKDGLQYARIQKADLRRQAKGLQKVHLRDCLIDAQEKKQHKRVAPIKQKCQREESKRMWYLIKRTVKTRRARASCGYSRWSKARSESTHARKMWSWQFNVSSKHGSLEPIAPRLCRPCWENGFAISQTGNWPNQS